MKHPLKPYLLRAITTVSRRFVWLAATTLIIPVAASVVISGPSSLPDQTTSFPLLPHAYNQTTVAGYSANTLIWFTGARTAPTQDTNPLFGLSGIRSFEDKLTPLITTNASIRYGQTSIPSQPNPLYGKSILLLDSLANNPVVVTSDDPKTLYIINGTSITKDNAHSILYGINPATDNSSIIALSAFQANKIDFEGGLNPSMGIIYITAPSAGLFGSDPTTIGISHFALIKKPNAPEDDPGTLTLGNLAPYLLSANLAVFSIQSPIVGLGRAPVVTTQNQINKAYIGVQVQGAPQPSDGVQAVVCVDITMRAEASTDTPIQLLSPSLVTGNNIVAAIGSSVNLVITGLRVMRTSTGLPYLIVQGGLDSNPQAQASLYALPLLNHTGRLASISLDPVTVYEQRNGHPYAVNRLFQQPPINEHDIYTADDIRAQVGGGPLHAPITDFVVAGDAIFAATATIDEGQAPGLWHSQAIIGATGAVLRWTPWKRAGGSAAAIPVYGFSYNQYKGVFFIISGPDPDNTDTVLTSNWTQSSPLSRLATTHVAPQHGGIQGITDYARRAQDYPALTFFMGYTALLVAQTDELIEPPVAPVTYTTPRISYETGFESPDGTLNNFNPTNKYSWIYCSGGSIETLGALMSATIASDGNQSWFVVAGSGGLAVLSEADGTGWPTAQGLGEQFAHLSATMAWRTVQITYQGRPINAIRKIICDRNQLYILANSGLYRITPQPQLFSGTAPQEATALSLSTGVRAKGEHTDCFIKDSLAVIATQSGLWHNGNATQIDTASDDEQLAWKIIDLPYSPGPVASLYTIGPVARTPDDGYDANLWVVTSAVSLHQVKVFRVAISYSGAIDSTTVRLFPDEIIAHQNAYFLSCSHYRNSIATDGALLALSRSRYINEPALSRINTPSWYRWPYYNFAANTQIEESGFPILATIPEASRITAHGLVQCSASGAWFAPGNFGVISNE